jgi:hypothetical protein
LHSEDHDTGGTSPELASHNLRVDPDRSMRAITAEVETLLDGLEEASLRSGALLASELIAQVVGRDPEFQGEPVGLTIHVRQGIVRMEATGPRPPSVGVSSNGDSPRDPIADWGSFILDRLADRWGVNGRPQQAIWAEIRRPATAYG